MTRHRKKPQKSLRTILVTWFLFFSIVPIAVVTIYSLQAYKHSLENVVLQKLEGNKREIIRVFQDLEITLSRSSRRHASQKGLKYYLYRNLKRQIVESAMQWMNSTVIVHKLTIYNRTGGLIVSLSQNSEGKIYRDESLEKGDYFLPKEFLEKFEDTSANRKYIDFSKDNSLQLISFTRIVTDKGRLLGYLEEVVELNKKFFDDIKSKLNVELVIFDKNNFLYSGNQLSMLTPKYLKQLYLEGKSFNKVELGNGENFSFLFSDISWGDQQVVFGVGASNTQSEKTLDSISWALFSMFAAILILLFVLSFIISRLILKPLYSLLDAIQNIDLNSDYIEIPVEVENELGLLTKSFNEMAKELFYSQQILKKNIGELEEANQKIKDTQIQLVHSEKMASLGQLVAGVAHELNNPIGFINSNMVHLKEYSESLIKLINEIEKNPKKIKQLKEDIDFDYLTQDLPKLIKSCEDGSRRTKEIVLGLRSFSRIDEAELKLSDLHEGIDSTLRLISGELKTKVKVEKDYGNLPQIMCYPSQLNQVFLNILSNAAHAIERQGTIKIKTELRDKNKVVVIISDDGMGMNKEVMQKIFDPFFTTKEQGKGTGLGMSISFGIIEKHNGQILVDSKEGKGTTFTIILPI